MKIIVFDKDGVILDQMPDILEAHADVLEPLGIPRSEIKKFIFETRGNSAVWQIKAILSKYKKTQNTSELEARYWKILMKKIPKAFPDALECIPKFYRNGYTLVLSTGARPDVAEEELKKISLRKYFDLILGSIEGKITKGDNHIKIVKEKYKLTDKDLKEVIMVGDGSFEIKLAKRHGMKAYGIDRGGSRSELKEAGSNKVFSNLHELCNFLEIL